MRVLVIIPAFNEEGALRDLLPEFLGTAWPEGMEVQALVIDDASADSTSDVARLHGIRCLRLPVNLGIGGAVQTGYRYALDNGFEVAVQMDGDGQHPPAQVASLLESLQDADMLIGSRFLRADGFHSTRVRRMGIRYFNTIIRLLCGIRVTDSTSGLRALSRRALAIVADDYPDEYPEPVSTVILANRGMRIRETSVEMRERSHGRSSIRSLGSVYYTLKVSVAMLLAHLRTKSKQHG